MMEYASQHRVQVAVFNDSLLSHGALFSASSVPADIAATIVGGSRCIPERQLAVGYRPSVKLSDIEIKTNP